MTFVRFGMIVTGEGERQFLPKLFRAVNAGAHCVFEVIRKSAQLRPITSRRRLLKLRNRAVASIEEAQYGLPALSYLRQHSGGFVLVIDDLEAYPDPQAVFDRYRSALNSVLRNPAESERAAVFFLVNMLEAYYFAHAECVNAVAEKRILPEDHPGDVEQIRHPKNDLKQRWPQFREIEHGALIVEKLKLEHILSAEDRCLWLRSMIAWCVDRLSESAAVWDEELDRRLRLSPEACAPLTRKQGVATS